MQGRFPTRKQTSSMLRTVDTEITNETPNHGAQTS